MDKRAKIKMEVALKGEPIDIWAERKEAFQAFHGGFIREIVFGFNDGVIATFATAFMVGAAIPITPYLFLPLAQSLTASIALSLVCLFLMDTVKSIITHRSWVKSGLEMLTIGAVAAGSAYIIGMTISI